MQGLECWGAGSPGAILEVASQRRQEPPLFISWALPRHVALPPVGH